VRPTVPKRVRDGFLVTGVDIIYRGVCPGCASRHGASRTR
jgi:hypothetical protein